MTSLPERLLRASPILRARPEQGTGWSLLLEDFLCIWGERNSPQRGVSAQHESARSQTSDSKDCQPRRETLDMPGMLPGGGTCHGALGEKKGVGSTTADTDSPAPSLCPAPHEGLSVTPSRLHPVAPEVGIVITSSQTRKPGLRGGGPCHHHAAGDSGASASPHPHWGRWSPWGQRSRQGGRVHSAALGHAV